MLSEKEAIELVQGDYGKFRHQQTTTYVAPFYWGVPGRDSSTSIKNGTISFINLGEATIGVTAGHVYKQYIEDKAMNKNIVCNIMSESFDPQENIIDYNFDKNVDLATFKISEHTIRNSKKTILDATHTLTPIKKNDPICFAGYPGKEREEKFAVNGTPLLSFGIYSNLAIASEVNDERIMCEFKESTVSTIGQGLPQMSKCALRLISTNKNRFLENVCDGKEIIIFKIDNETFEIIFKNQSDCEIRTLPISSTESLFSKIAHMNFNEEILLSNETNLDCLYKLIAINDGHILRDYDLGGISGGILLKRDPGEIETWSFGGIIREALLCYGIVLASPANLILRNGQLRCEFKHQVQHETR